MSNIKPEIQALLIQQFIHKQGLVASPQKSSDRRLQFQILSTMMEIEVSLSLSRCWFHYVIKTLDGNVQKGEENLNPDRG